MFNKATVTANPMVPFRGIIIDNSLCIGCNKCVNVCRTDVLLPHPERGKPPLVMYPDECWFCGCCVSHCSVRGAIRVEQPLNQKAIWKRKETGECFRIGMKNPPLPNNRPPIT